MKKSIKNPHIGQLVVVTESLETQVYTVADMTGNMVVLQWREGERHCSQGYDRWCLLEPTVAQIQHSIKENGPLVSVNDIVEWA